MKLRNVNKPAASATATTPERGNNTMRNSSSSGGVGSSMRAWGANTTANKQQQRQADEALESAKQLVERILGHSNSQGLTATACQQALDQYHLLEKEAYRMNDELARAKSQKSKHASAQAARMQVEAAEKRWTISKLEQDVQERDSRIAVLEGRVRGLEEEATCVGNGSNANQEEEIERLEKEVNDAQKQVFQLENANQSLEDRLEEQQEQSNKELAEAKQKVADLEEEIKLQEGVNSDLEKQVHKLEDDNNTLEKQVSSMEELEKQVAAMKETEQRFKDLESEALFLESQKAELTDQLEELKEDHAHATERFEEEVRQAHATIEELECEIEDREKVNAQLEQVVRDLEDQNELSLHESALRLHTEDAQTRWAMAKLENDYRILEQRNQALENVVKELEERNEEQHANAQVRSLELENWRLELQKQKNGLDKSGHTLNDSGDPQSSLDASNEILRTQLEQSLKELADARQTEEKLRMQLKAASSHALLSTGTSLVLNADDVAELEGLVDEKVIETKILEQELQDARDQLAAARLEIDFLTQKMEQQQQLPSSAITASRNSSVLSSQSSSDLETEKNELHGKLVAAESVIDYLTDKLVDMRLLETKVRDLERLVKQKDMQLSSATTAHEPSEQVLDYAAALSLPPANEMDRIPELERLVEELQSQLEECRSQLSNAESELQSVSTNAQNLANKLVQLEMDREKDAQETEQLQSHVQEQQAQLSAKDTEIENLTAKVEENAELQFQLADLQDMLSAKQSEAERIQTQLGEVEVKLSGAQAEVETLTVKLDDRENNKDLQAELEECQSKLAAAQAEIDSLEQSLVATRVSLAKSNSRQNKHDSLTVDSNDLKSGFMAEMASKASADTNESAISGSTTRSRSTIAEDASREELEKELDRLNDVIEDMDGQLKFTENKNTSLQRELKDVQRSLKTAQARASYFEDQDFFFDGDEEDFSARTSPMLSSLQDEVAEAKEAAKESYEEVVELKKVVKEKNVEIAELKKKIDQENRVSETLRSEVNDFGTQLYDVESQRDALEDKLASAEESLKTANDKIASLEDEAKDVRKAEEEFEAANATIKSLRQELADSAARSDETESFLERERKLEDQIQRVEEEKEELRAELDDLHNKLSDALTENNRLAENSVDFEQTLAEAREKTLQLKREVAMLKQAEQRSADLEAEVVMLKQAEQLAAQEFADVASQKKKLAEAKNRVDEAEQLIEEFVDLEERLQQELLEKENMHKLLGDYRIKLSASDLKINSLTQLLEDLSKEAKRSADETRESDANKDALISSLRQALDEARARVDEAQEVEQNGLDKERLQNEVNALQAQLTIARTAAEETEHELKFSKAKVSELSGILKKRNSSRAEDVLLEKSIKLAEITAERDLLQGQMKRITTRSQSLEQECQFKDAQINASWEPADVNIKRLKEEHEHSLKQATELSVKLADSQMKIDLLTEELKKARTKNDSSHSKQTKHNMADFWSTSNAQSTKERFSGAANDLTNMISSKFISGSSGHSFAS